jgi:hypothetical protein
MDVEAFIDAPGARDITLGELVDDAMFAELAALMTAQGFAGVEAGSKGCMRGACGVYEGCMRGV